MPLQMSGTGNVEKAFIAKILDGKMTEIYDFQFNFQELAIGHTAEYNFINPPGSMRPTAIYKATPGPDFSFSVMVDKSSSYTELGVMPDLAFFESLVTPDVDTYLQSNARWIAPPRLVFVVGVRAWDVVCLAANQKEVRYTRDMIPQRATIDVTLKPFYIDQNSIVAYLESLKGLYKNRVTKLSETNPYR